MGGGQIVTLFVGAEFRSSAQEVLEEDSIPSSKSLSEGSEAQ